MSTKTERQSANIARREAAAAKQKPLPMHEQQRRADAKREARERRYPNAPYIDPLSQVRGDPRGKDQPFSPRPVPRRLTLADLIYAFDVTGLLELRMRRRKRAA